MTARIDWLNAAIWGAIAIGIAAFWMLWGFPALAKVLALLIQTGGTALRGVM